MSGTLKRDDNDVPVSGGVSSTNANAVLPFTIDPITGRLLTDTAAGSGTVTSVSVVSANGFAGTVATATTTPAITLSTTVTGVLKGNGTAISAAVNSDLPTMTATVGGAVPTPPNNTTTFLRGDGTFATPSSSGITGSGNANEIAYFTGATAIGSLAVATYPSLTELSYVKGVTSALQTQINAKGSGTVTATGGALTANAVVLGAGTTDTKVVAGIITDGTAKLILGVNATTLGTVKMFGNTSGDVTVQPTAAAGTATVQTLPATTGVLVNRVTTAAGVSASNSDGALTFTLGAITPSTVNGNTFTTGSSTYTGTAAQTYTFPTTTATIARTDAAQTFTGTQTFAQVITTANAITASGNAATVPVTSRHNIVTNNSAATLTITLTTTSAVNMQTVVVQILDFSAAAQTITWVNTENSTVTAPATSNGSTTLPLTVGFIYNSATSKWRCIASA